MHNFYITWLSPKKDNFRESEIEIRSLIKMECVASFKCTSRKPPHFYAVSRAINYPDNESSTEWRIKLSLYYKWGEFIATCSIRCDHDRDGIVCMRNEHARNAILTQRIIIRRTSRDSPRSPSETLTSMMLRGRGPPENVAQGIHGNSRVSRSSHSPKWVYYILIKSQFFRDRSRKNRVDAKIIRLT